MTKFSEQKFWIFQTNPTTTYDIFSWWSYWKRKQDTFWVKQHRYEIHKGDMTAIWVARGDSKEDIRGIYAIAEIISNPQMKKLTPPEKLSYFLKAEDKEKLRKELRLQVDIYYRVGPQSNPIIGISAIKNDDILSQLTILQPKKARGTNFRVTPTQWQRITQRIMDLT